MPKQRVDCGAPRRSSAIRAARSLSGAILLILAISACASPPAPPAPKMKVTIAATTLPSSAAVYVAHEKGYFRAEGLDDEVRLYGAGRLALEAALERKVDVAMVAETPIVGAVLRRRTPHVIATVCEIDGANVIVGRKDRGIKTAHDLIGKRIGVFVGTSSDFFLHIYLVTSDVDPKAVTVVPLTTDNLVSSLVSGKVDAIAAFAPYTFQSQDRLGTNATVLGQPGLYTTFWKVATSREFARRRSDALVAFLRAIRRANLSIAAHPTEAQRITARWTGISLANIRRTWSTYHWTLELEQPLLLALEDESRWMSSESTTPDFLRYLDGAPLKRVEPGAVRLIEPRN